MSETYQCNDASRLEIPCTRKICPYMSSRADVYRQRAADAKKRAAQAKDLSVKKAFEEVARGWLVLAQQMEWMDRQRSTSCDSLGPSDSGGNRWSNAAKPRCDG